MNHGTVEPAESILSSPQPEGGVQVDTSLLFRERGLANAAKSSQRLVVWLLVSRRVVGFVLAVAGWLWRSGWELDQAGLTLDALGAVFVFVMLYTEKGRSLLFLGWLSMVVVFVLNLVYVEFRWDVVQALPIVLVVGACWFVDWKLVKRKVGWSEAGRLPAVPRSRG